MDQNRRRRTVPIILWLLFLTAVSLAPARAGEILYQKSFGAGAAKPATFNETVVLPEGRGPYVLNLVNGTADGQSRSVRVRLSWNGAVLIAPAEVKQETQALNRDLAAPRAGGEALALTVDGSAGSFVTVRVLGSVVQARPGKDPNEVHRNADGSLEGENARELVVLRATRQSGASLYVFYAAGSPGGPWREIRRTGPGDASRPYVTVVDDGYDTGAQAFGPEDFLSSTTYFRLEALDDAGHLLRDYPVLAVPPYVEWTAAPPGAPARADVLAGETGACGDSCVYNQAFLSDKDFTDAAAMDQAMVREFLNRYSGFLAQSTVVDLDGVSFDPARVIHDSAVAHDLNPQVLLATIQKESSAFTDTDPSSTKLHNLTGTDAHDTLRHQIDRAAENLRRYFDGESGWHPDTERLTCDFVPDTSRNVQCTDDHNPDRFTVCPSNDATAALFQYTPYVGREWGGEAGGNALFSKIYYDQFHFGTRPLACGTFRFSGESPGGDVGTGTPMLSVKAETVEDCPVTYTLSLDGMPVQSGQLPAGGTVSYTVTSPLAPGRHMARLVLAATDCRVPPTRHEWTFTVTPGRKIGLVIDDTGSMGDEIEGVKTQLNSFIDRQTADPNHPDIEWTLITFKDDVTVRGTTSDSALIKSWVSGLFASGGGDCPEDSLDALEAAAQILKGEDGERAVVFATDASPHDGDVEGTIADLRAGGIPVEVVLTGDCVGTAAAARPQKGTSPLSSRDVFSHIASATGGLFFYLPGPTPEQLNDAFAQILQSAGGQDLAPPALGLELSPSQIWPPTGQMVEIAPVVSLHDDVDRDPTLQLVSVVSSDPAPPGDIQLTPDGRILVRSAVSPAGSRIYTATYRAIDAAGHSTTASAQVTIRKVK